MTITAPPQPPKLSNYVTGGLNPNSCGTCETCVHRLSYNGNDSGWCSIRNNASVSATGGCKEHLKYRYDGKT